MLLLSLLLPACDRPAAGYPTPGASLSVTATELTFAEVPLGASMSQSFEVENAGDRSETVTASITTTIEPSPFALATPTVTVSPGATATVTVRYTPMDYASAAGALTLTGSDTTIGLTLAGSTALDGDLDGQDALAAGGTDCDDTDPAIYVGAPDACYDGIDADCDAGAGLDPEESDCDADGVTLPEDCDDEDPSVHTGALELASGAPDGLDQDCDGMIDEDFLLPGELVITEIATGTGGWIEVCNGSGRAIPVGGFVIDWSSGSAALDAAVVDFGSCLAICERHSNDCLLEADFTFHGAADTLRVLGAETTLDTVVITADWGWADGQIWSLDSAATRADLNDSRSNWCATGGSQGTPNPDCP